MRFSAIRDIALFCTAVAFLSLVMVPVAALPGNVQQVSLLVTLPPSAQPYVTTEIVHLRNISTIARRPAGLSGAGDSGQIVRVNRSVINRSGTGMSLVTSDGNLSGNTINDDNPADNDTIGDNPDKNAPAFPPGAIATPADCGDPNDLKHLEDYLDCMNQSGTQNQTENGFGTADQKSDQLMDILSGILKTMNDEKNSFGCLFGGC